MHVGHHLAPGSPSLLHLLAAGEELPPGKRAAFPELWVHAGGEGDTECPGCVCARGFAKRKPHAPQLHTRPPSTEQGGD